MTREEFRAKLEALCESEATVLTLKNESMLREAEAEDSRRIAMIDQLLAAWDARFNEGIEAAAKRVGGMPYESCFPFCEHTIDGAVKRIRALRKE